MTTKNDNGKVINFKCADCKSEISTEYVFLKTGCYSTSPAYSCVSCGRLHWGDKTTVENKQGAKAYLINNNIIHKDNEGNKL